MNFIQHYFICRPSDSAVSKDEGTEPRTVATSALTIRHSSTRARLDLIHLSLFYSVCSSCYLCKRLRPARQSLGTAHQTGSTWRDAVRSVVLLRNFQVYLEVPYVDETDIGLLCRLTLFCTLSKPYSRKMEGEIGFIEKFSSWSTIRYFLIFFYI
jgi:hypothetical protein